MTLCTPCSNQNRLLGDESKAVVAGRQVCAGRVGSVGAAICGPSGLQGRARSLQRAVDLPGRSLAGRLGLQLPPSAEAGDSRCGSDPAARRDRFRLGRADAAVRCSGLGCHGGPVGSVPSGPRAQQRLQRMAAQSRVGRVVAWGPLQQAVGPARRGSRAAVGRLGRRLGAQANAVGEYVRGPGRVPPAPWRLQRARAAGRRIPRWPSG